VIGKRTRRINVVIESWSSAVTGGVGLALGFCCCAGAKPAAPRMQHTASTSWLTKRFAKGVIIVKTVELVDCLMIDKKPAVRCRTNYVSLPSRCDDTQSENPKYENILAPSWPTRTFFVAGSVVSALCSLQCSAVIQCARPTPLAHRWGTRLHVWF